MKTQDFSKYRGIIAAISLFVFFTVGVMALNFYLSTRIGAEARSVNLAARQRDLSQRMVASLLLIDSALKEGRPIDDPLEVLRTSHDLFERTLTVFANGGAVTGVDGNQVIVVPISTERGQAILYDTVETVWEPYAELLGPVVSFTRNPYAAGATATNVRYSPAGSALVRDVASAVAGTRAHNTRLYYLMNNLSAHLDDVAVRRAQNLRRVQLAGIILSLALFAVIILYFVRNLTQSDARIARARKETGDILGTVREGLFLIDKDKVIGSQHSAAMRSIFRRDDIAGLRFDHLLRRIVPQKTLMIANDYVELLFGDRVNEKLVKTLNPLDEVAVHFESPAGGLDTHYLGFDFTRVNVDESLDHLLVSVTDITDRVELARELKRSETQAKEQLDMLQGILHVDPDLLLAFLKDSEVSLAMVNGVLKQPSGNADAYREKLASIFRQIHAVKGEAGALGLDLFETRAHAFEDLLGGLRDRKTVTGKDLLPLVVKLDELFATLGSLKALVGRLSALRVAVTRDAARRPAPDPADAHHGIAPESDLPVTGHRRETAADRKPATAAAPASVLEVLAALAARVAHTQGKEVSLRCVGVEGPAVPERYRGVIKDIAVQLIRNGITHGIERPEVRVAASKPPVGKLQLEFRRRADESYELSFYDDGQGLATDRIRAAAIERGLLTASDAEDMDPRQILSLIFRPGFSTSATIDQDSGRGVGMDLVRNLVNGHGGSIRMSTLAGHHTQFRVFLPAVGSKSSTAAA